MSEYFISVCCEKKVSFEEATLNHGLCNECMDKEVQESNERMSGKEDVIQKFGFSWEKIEVKEINSYLGLNDIMSLCGKDFFFIEKTDVPPDYIRFDFFIKGKWYIKKEEKQ